MVSIHTHNLVIGSYFGISLIYALIAGFSIPISRDEVFLSIRRYHSILQLYDMVFLLAFVINPVSIFRVAF
ncbi:hypothetical protein [Candidatus Ruthturnera calyptogenae]|uniref:hypothetical protein n=1 Tax=Candidatus Ruthturnera calyptogenae TaxID=386487 RepID=UPI00059C99FF|nr:hypothetical protein [Candidatus Ruthturnera calyptogenae]